MEALLVWTLALGGAALLVGRSGAAWLVGRRGGRGWLALALAAALLLATAAAQRGFSVRQAAAARSDDALRAQLPGALREGGYVSSDGCRACHPREHATWRRSFHRTMTQAASAATVRAPFAGETLRDDDGRRYRLERRGDQIWADIEGTGARRIALVTGSHHMQAFWLPGAGGNEQVEFPFTYLLDERRWVSRRDVFLVGSEYDKAPSRWNRICIECHVTGGQPGLDAGGVPRSRVAELGIACEACHGPAAAHVAANASPWRRFGLHAGDGADATIVNPARLAAGRASEVCGQCHGIGCPPDDWLQHGIGFRPGQSLAATKPILRLATLATSACGAQIAADPSFATTRYWRDGMVRVSGREYNGVLESPCAADARFGCLSCHAMHDSDPAWQLTRGQDDRSNAACARCHPAIAGNVAAHSHHQASSTGAICYNCHMPHTTYGLLRAMRSHQVSVPRVADTVATGRPNACNLCHMDRPLGWTATALQRWYGATAPALTAEQRTLAASLVDVARGDAGVRALWAWSLGWAPARAVAGGGGNATALTALLIELLDDDYAAVRAIAARSLGAWDGFGDWRFDFVAPREARWAAQAEARRRAARSNGGAARPALLIDDDGRFVRGELERLMAGRDDDDQMFLAE